jgi:POT family proton-dependent oligopeptide transporter
MAKYKYATSPPNITKMPPGVPFIIGNEAAERFSFYGMRSILIVFMTQYIVTSSGVADHMAPAEARQNFALFRRSSGSRSSTASAISRSR